LEDPKHHRQLFLIGTTNSSTMLAERTKDLINREKPDSVFVQTNEQWWDIVKQLQGVNTQREMNNYHQVLRATQEWQTDNAPRGLIFKARFYPWLATMTNIAGMTI
jgi:pheromone shutdown protein TraB